MRRGTRRVDALRYFDAGKIALVAVPRIVRMRWVLDHDGYAAARAEAERMARRRRSLRLGPAGIAAVVHRVASFLPPRLNCLPQALTLWSLTRAAGMPTELKIGVAPRNDDGQRIEAHAWVELHGCALGESAERYVILPIDEHRSGLDSQRSGLASPAGRVESPWLRSPQDLAGSRASGSHP